MLDKKTMNKYHNKNTQVVESVLKCDGQFTTALSRMLFALVLIGIFEMVPSLKITWTWFVFFFLFLEMIYLHTQYDFKDA